MICPHCKKQIERKVNKEAFVRARALLQLGYSYRDIEKLLFAEGIQVSFATLSRYFSNKAKGEK